MAADDYPLDQVADAFRYQLTGHARGKGVVARATPAALRWIAAGWSYLRAVSGDDAYERYLVHHATEPERA